MRRLRVGPSRIIGTCPAGHRIGDVQLIEGTTLLPEQGPVCYVAVGALTCQVTQIQWARRISSHVSCPGCGADPRNLSRVVFVLAWADVWPVVWKLSQYNWARKAGKESEQSRALNRKAWDLAGEGLCEEAESFADRALEAIGDD